MSRKPEKLIEPIDAPFEDVVRAVVKTKKVANRGKKGQESEMAKSICLFNHKGGVSKTTTAFNLGWCLAGSGKNVLIVDLDPQCNLSGLVFGYDATMDKNDYRLPSLYESRHNLTMRSIVESLINGMSPESFMLREAESKLLPTRNDNLQLLPGDLSVSKLDSQISVSLKIARGIPATKNIPGNLPEILDKIAVKFRFDYVIYDLSPNIGGLNEIMLMASDYFIVPTSPDYFCFQAITSLKMNIEDWHHEINGFIRDNEFDKRTFAIKNQPMFLGTIHQRYRPRSGKPAASFDRWIGEIRDAMNDEFIPSLRKINCVINGKIMLRALKGTDLVPYDLAQIPDFNSLIAISQRQSCPIFALTDDEIRETASVAGVVANTMIASRDSFRKIFSGLAKRVIYLTSQ